MQQMAGTSVYVSYLQAWYPTYKPSKVWNYNWKQIGSGLEEDCKWTGSGMVAEWKQTVRQLEADCKETGSRLDKVKLSRLRLEQSLFWLPSEIPLQRLYFDINFSVSGLLTSLLGWSQWKPLAMTVMFDGYHKHHKRLLWLIESPFKSVSVACLYLLLEPLLASLALWRSVGKKKTSIRQQHRQR